MLLAACVVLAALACGAHAAPVASHTVVSASPSILVGSPADVTVSWSNLEGEGPFVVGLFLAAPENMQCLAVVNISSTASGSVQVPVVNVRRNVFFAICNSSQCAGPNDRVAVSNTVSADPDAITQVRLAATNR
jgi:hypothetical protein